MSLNSPHLGYNENAYTHVNLGMYFLKLSKKNISLKQLSQTDQKNKE